MTALYDLISGPADFARDWSAVRELFHEPARLILAFTHGDRRTETIEWTLESFPRGAADDYRARGGMLKPGRRSERLDVHGASPALLAAQ